MTSLRERSLACSGRWNASGGERAESGVDAVDRLGRCCSRVWTQATGDRVVDPRQAGPHPLQGLRCEIDGGVVARHCDQLFQCQGGSPDDNG